MIPGREIEDSTDNVQFIELQTALVNNSLIVKTLKKHFIFSQLSTD